MNCFNVKRILKEDPLKVKKNKKSKNLQIRHKELVGVEWKYILVGHGWAWREVPIDYDGSEEVIMMPGDDPRLFPPLAKDKKIIRTNEEVWFEDVQVRVPQYQNKNLIVDDIFDWNAVLSVCHDKVKEKQELYEAIDQFVQDLMLTTTQLDLSNLIVRMKERREEIEREVRFWCRRYYLLRGWKIPTNVMDKKEYNVDLLKTKFTAHELLERYGIKVERKKCQCIAPNHMDNNPSMHVYEFSVYCFSCSQHYDTIGIVQLYESTSFPQALEILDRM